MFLCFLHYYVIIFFRRKHTLLDCWTLSCAFSFHVSSFSLCLKASRVSWIWNERDVNRFPCFGHVTGFNPMWEETLVFTLHMPQIALVRFMVWDHDPIGRDFIGQRTIAFKSMLPGKLHASQWHYWIENAVYIYIFVNSSVSLNFIISLIHRLSTCLFRRNGRSIYLCACCN